MADTVYMTHPDVEATAGPVTRKAFDTVWEPKGWMVAEPAAVAASRVFGGAGGDLGSLSMAQLRKLADQAGVALSGRVTKQELIEAIRVSYPAEQEG